MTADLLRAARNYQKANGSEWGADVLVAGADRRSIQCAAGTLIRRYPMKMSPKNQAKLREAQRAAHSPKDTVATKAAKLARADGKVLGKLPMVERAAYEKRAEAELQKPQSGDGEWIIPKRDPSQPLLDKDRLRELADQFDLADKFGLDNHPGFQLSIEDMKPIAIALRFTAERL